MRNYIKNQSKNDKELIKYLAIHDYFEGFSESDDEEEYYDAFSIKIGKFKICLKKEI